LPQQPDAEQTRFDSKAPRRFEARHVPGFAVSVVIGYRWHVTDSILRFGVNYRFGDPPAGR
jgi:hypothetical protein